ncbi:hypothetical protein EBR57_04940 [bacterium]|nr:hypothetical protein [bacterium]
MTAPLPDDLFKLDPETFNRFRKDPAAFNGYVNELFGQVASRFRSQMAMGKERREYPAAVPAPDIVMDNLFPIPAIARKPEPPSVAVPQRPVEVAPSVPPARRQAVSIPKVDRIADAVVDTKPRITHQVNHSVSVSEPVPVVTTAPVADQIPVPERTVVASVAPTPAPVVPKTDEPDPVKSRDLDAAEQRRKAREDALSSIMKKDQGNVL